MLRDQKVMTLLPPMKCPINFYQDMFKNMRQDFANNWPLVIVLGFDLYISFSLFEYVLIDGVVK